MWTLTKSPARRLSNRGFTLVEVAMATAIIGLGVTALLVSVASGTRANDSGQKLTQATFLAGEIREWTCKLPFKDPNSSNAGNPPGLDPSDNGTPNDLDDLLGAVYSPPRDGSGAPIADMVGWTQQITLTWRNPTNLSLVVTPGNSDIVNVDVKILFHSKEVTSASWLVSRRYSS
jgi:prepilin-type N-terminal cleavage/methylation domain-containing protein